MTKLDRTHGRLHRLQPALLALQREAERSSKNHNHNQVSNSLARDCGIGKCGELSHKPHLFFDHEEFMVCGVGFSCKIEMLRLSVRTIGIGNCTSPVLSHYHCDPVYMPAQDILTKVVAEKSFFIVQNFIQFTSRQVSARPYLGRPRCASCGMCTSKRLESGVRPTKTSARVCHPRPAFVEMPMLSNSPSLRSALTCSPRTGTFLGAEARRSPSDRSPVRSTSRHRR